MNRRMTSRSVSLTSTFLLLAAGGVAACDNGDDTQDEGFYCADENGVVVDEDNCDDDRVGGGGVGLLPFFIWHSAGYRPGYPVGSKLPAGRQQVRLQRPGRAVVVRPAARPAGSATARSRPAWSARAAAAPASRPSKSGG